MSAGNFALIAVVNKILREKRMSEEAAEQERRMKREAAEYDILKESVLRKSSASERVLDTYANGQVKEKTEYGTHTEYYENGKIKRLTTATGTETEYDEEGRLRREYIPYGGEYIYDALGRLKEENDSSETKEYFYYDDTKNLEHLLIKDSVGKITSYKHFTPEGKNDTKGYLRRLKMKSLRDFIMKKHDQEEDKGAMVSKNMQKNISKENSSSLSSRFISSIKNIFEK